jgi:hypothetical protein
METLSPYAESWLSVFPGEKRMKKSGKSLFILSVLLALGFSGCDGILSVSDGGDGVFSDIEESSGAANRGELRITGIDPRLYGTYRVYVNNTDSESYYTNNPAATASGVSLSASTLTVKLTAGGSPWAGEGAYYVYLQDQTTGNLAAKSGRINFVNGAANNNATIFTVMGLVVTGFSARLYGTYRVYVNSSNSESTYKNASATSSSTVSIQRSTLRLDLTTRNSSARWTGTGEYYDFLEDTAGNLKAKSGPISFANGNGTVGSFTEITGRLTITDSVLSGSYKVYVVNDADNESTYKSNYRAAFNSTTYIDGTLRTVQLTTSNGSLWADTGNYYVFLEDSSGNLAAKSGSVSFRNGNGTVSSFTEITDRLIITNIDSSSYGTYRVYVHDSDVGNDPTAYTNNPEAFSGDISINQAEARIDLDASGGGSWTGGGYTGAYYYVFLENTDTTIPVRSAQVRFTRGRGSVSFSAFY